MKIKVEIDVPDGNGCYGCFAFKWSNERGIICALFPDQQIISRNMTAYKHEICLNYCENYKI